MADFTAAAVVLAAADLREGGRMVKFTKNDLSEISSAVKKAEKKTSGEIVPLITEKAENYFEGSVIFAFLTLLSVTLIYLLVSPWRSVRGLLVWQVAGLLLGSILVNIFPRLRLLCLGSEYIAKATRQRAIRAFYEHGLRHTRDKTGILIALFLQEKRVEVVADEGIAKKYPQKTWDEVVELIIQNAKKGQIKTGFIKGIERCGELLAKKCQIKHNDKNELKNRLIVE